MAKQFTADEMREIADELGLVNDEYHRKASAMLLQSADMMEREDDSERKYEYSIKNPNGNIMKCHEDEMFPIMPLICKVVRREVGEWKEVPNG